MIPTQKQIEQLVADLNASTQREMIVSNYPYLIV